MDFLRFKTSIVSWEEIVGLGATTKSECLLGSITLYNSVTKGQSIHMQYVAVMFDYKQTCVAWS